MKISQKMKQLGILSVLLAMTMAFTPKTANAQAYFGIEGGLGTASGTFSNVNSGFAYGATAGFQLLPSFGVGATFLHSSLGFPNSDVGYSASQMMLEANVFSLLLLNGGIHAGDVHTSIGDATSDDFGFGAHVGFDVRVTEKASLGLTAYWTYVTQSNDKHSLFNFMIPLKYWF